MSERYDIEARTEGDPTFDAMLPMLQSLVEDRLHVKFHRETKDLPVYALVVAKPRKVHVSEGECGPRPNTPPPPPEPGKMPPPGCGSIATLNGHITAEKVPIAVLIEALSRLTDRMVLDRTNLTGKYDIDLQYAPEPAEFPPGLPPRAPVDERPSFFTAVQEQLGLKWESQKGLVEMFVVDRVERPSEN